MSNVALPLRHGDTTHVSVEAVEKDRLALARADSQLEAPGDTGPARRAHVRLCYGDDLVVPLG
jgi:hypothetical protein